MQRGALLCRVDSAASTCLVRIDLKSGAVIEEHRLPRFRTLHVSRGWSLGELAVSHDAPVATRLCFVDPANRVVATPELTAPLSPLRAGGGTGSSSARTGGSCASAITDGSSGRGRLTRWGSATMRTQVPKRSSWQPTTTSSSPQLHRACVPLTTRAGSCGPVSISSPSPRRRLPPRSHGPGWPTGVSSGSRPGQQVTRSNARTEGTRSPRIRTFIPLTNAPTSFQPLKCRIRAGAFAAHSGTVERHRQSVWGFSSIGRLAVRAQAPDPRGPLGRGPVIHRLPRPCPNRPVDIRWHGASRDRSTRHPESITVRRGAVFPRRRPSHQLHFDCGTAYPHCLVGRSRARGTCDFH